MGWGGQITFGLSGAGQPGEGGPDPGDAAETDQQGGPTPSSADPLRKEIHNKDSVDVVKEDIN